MLSETKLKQLTMEITGRDDLTEALEETLRSYVEQRLSHYRREINQLEDKYGITYEAFREKLNKLFPLTWEHEQDLMTWEEAVTNIEYFEDLLSQPKVHVRWG